MSSTDLATMSDQIELAILGEGEGLPILEDPDQIAKDISARILSAESMDAVFQQGEVTHAKDLAGQPFFITGCRWQKSQYAEGGPQVYALMEIDYPDGESSALVTCGSRNVMAQLFWCWKRNEWPQHPMTIDLQKTAQGFDTMWLVPFKGKQGK